MMVRDWRSIAPPDMGLLYEREVSRWQIAYGWDTTSSWRAVETARTTWGLPGLVCVSPDNQIHGWTFYMPAEGGLDIGGLVADSVDATGMLLDALIDRAGSPAKVRGLVCVAAPSVLEGIAVRGVPGVRCSYRRRTLQPAGAVASFGLGAGDATVGLAAWSDACVPDAALLLQQAYEGRPSPLGPDATVAQWSEYLTNLIRHDGCGTFLPDLSRIVRVNGALAAVALVSSIGPQTAHLVQLAVSPFLQRGGVGRALLARTMNAAREAQFTSMSLLVSEDNRPAMRLYKTAGFVERGVFVRLGASEASRHAEPPMMVGASSSAHAEYSIDNPAL